MNSIFAFLIALCSSLQLLILNSLASFLIYEAVLSVISFFNFYMYLNIFFSLYNFFLLRSLSISVI
jgi:hypothetical protein